ncbi:ABC transporter substrate-binding protein [Kaistia dalseonensis]|uniref:Hydroxymethylpyrimidine transport system substrate-binding protein n=1 Tax=Kaistia dalseonensis TaxID=410840 RepID=A0ABU0HA06_9HYPH|nr:ABC transporter substrate-binding protein [Kaistia dalseonensis]MCX5496526.1 ABC transporter substrate-binding protein [Kaistia dalseonensis]MDQ0439148.1 putative hydroxymethylpyrimidine transport system substrate-binding protein [Kaistia dalseonensis]
MKPLLSAASALLAAALFVTPAAAADKMTVLLDWFVNPDHAPLVVAKEGGFFERQGLDVELIAPADASAPPRLVAAGQADIAVTYQPDLMLQVKEGLPLTRIGTLIETPLNCLIVLKDGPIKTLADLKGKKIGYSVASLQQVYIDAILGSAGLTTKDVEMINVNFNLSTSLMSGQVDAVIDGYRNFELTQLAIEGKPGVAFFPEEHGVPPYDELIFATRNELRTDPRMARFITAIEDATIFLTNHPDEALAMFLKAYPDLDDKLNRQAFADTLPRFAKRPAALDPGRYDRFAQFLKDGGLLDTVPAVDSYAITPR